MFPTIHKGSYSATPSIRNSNLLGPSSHSQGSFECCLYSLHSQTYNHFHCRLYYYSSSTEYSNTCRFAADFSSKSSFTNVNLLIYLNLALQISLRPCWSKGSRIAAQTGGQENSQQSICTGFKNQEEKRERNVDFCNRNVEFLRNMMKWRQQL